MLFFSPLLCVCVLYFCVFSFFLSLLLPLVCEFVPFAPPPSFMRPLSGFYKAREGLVSLPPEMVGIVEVRDHGRIVGIIVVICWIFPC